jgi:phage terminase large subunit-like protein
VKKFDLGWLPTPFKDKPFTRNYLLVDPANSKKKNSTYTSMWVVGICGRGYYYVLDGVFDKMQISERCFEVFRLIQEWNINTVFYERQAMQIDVDWIEDRKPEYGIYFSLIETHSNLPKVFRIEKLQPLFQAGRVLLPPKILYTTVEDKVIDLVQIFRDEEYSLFPKPFHFDMLDNLAKIVDPNITLSRPPYKEPKSAIADYNPIFDRKPRWDRYSWLNYG